MSFFTREARDEVRKRPETEKRTPGQTHEILQLAFQESETVSQLQKQFFRREQNTGEYLQQYSLNLMKLVDRILKKDKDCIGDRYLLLKDRFIDGTRNPQLRREMRKHSLDHKGESFADFRSDVLSWLENDSSYGAVQSTSSVQEAFTQDTVSNEGVRASATRQSTTNTAGEQLDGSPDLLKLLQCQQEMLQKQLDMLSNLTEENRRLWQQR